MGKPNREINVFSASAIDLFASSLGVFIVLVIIIFPYYRKTSKTPPREITQTENPEVIEQLKAEKIEIETENETLVKKVKLLQQQIEAKDQTELVKELQKKIEETQKQVEQVKKENQEIQQKVTTVKNEKIEVEEQLKQVKEQLKVVSSKSKNTQDLVKKIDTKSREISSLKAELKKVKEATPPPTQENVEEIKKELKQTRDELREMKQKFASNGSFAAIIAQWDTEKHDIDLVVKDASGKVFDFKRRKVSGSAGHFALDSRTGPGAELWQSGSLVPGRYEVTYKFYNNYGNTKPAVVEGTVFTRKGGVPLPKATLVFPSKRKVSYRIEIDDAGNVTQLK